ncbi:hypothetical protein Curi_c12690 [Gottschalkia acidurici 9a]|uniref:Uncharacterized protein n=1 Tax=Gottschalkia acidurici (strain ATCC 7906 / DSM 604 / BCRC 14475 / CIP 104303 / KCTC 5404 / NCIMB 10678 / 9a) TaxID=1128398 RepID=K0AZX8_GOTA9|nr:hypothetical protein [Gottschalkia acidurici]AFS78280.1 hypothetical protein Curi_c12690 [Gottschalkia acidurici 9a]
MGSTNKDVVSKISSLYSEIFEHDGFGQMTIEVKILKKGQKEILIHCGKQYRFVVDYPSSCNLKIVSNEDVVKKRIAR